MRPFLPLRVLSRAAILCGAVMLLSSCRSSSRAERRTDTVARTNAPVPPNIVVLLADDLGIGEVGAWGQQDITTPHIDRLARDGMRFTEFRSSAAVCGPARCSLMMGLHNGTCRLDDNDNDYLRTADITLPERLHDAGYVTGLFGKWGLSWDSEPESWPNAQGFDEFFGYRDQVHAHNFYPEWLLSGTDSVRTRNVVPNAGRMGAGRATTRLDYAPTLIRDRAFRFVRTHRDRPFFLYWATNLPHINNEGSKGEADGGYEIPSLGAYAAKPWPVAKQSYAAQVSRLDEDLGGLRSLLDSLGIAERTLIVFLSDNGATFLRRTNDGTTDIVGRWFNGTLGYRGFKGDLYEGGLRVPGIAYWPGRTTPGSASAVRVDFTDLHATLVEAAGQTPPRDISGRSFLPAVTGTGTLSLRPYQVWYSPDRTQSAVLEGAWKAVWMRDTMQLFNLQADPGERTDRVSSEPAVAARLDAIRRTEDRRRTHPPLRP
ncbi:MAG: sulfatase-like hydrolase/transferase [Gemmatimonadota bacterium]|nr:sulfatase-like hydrolase/transferase [Gemmatimonadota bacterium]MDQ8172764.1 sulfatase-like hydrolase/transferase [Gemmatimonadota bacterium]